MSPLVTKPLVVIDGIYSLDEVTVAQTIRFLNSLKKNDIEVQVELTLKNYGKGLGKVF